MITVVYKTSRYKFIFIRLKPISGKEEHNNGLCHRYFILMKTLKMIVNIKTTISQCFHHFLSYGLYTIIKTAYYPYLLVFIGKNEIIENCDYNALI